MQPFNLQKIEEPVLSEHSCLTSNDHCYFFGDYTGRMRFDHSPMNDLMQNFKKPVERKKNPNEWWHKENAISQVANLIKQTSIWGKLKKCLWVPMPSSKKKTDVDHDDRLMMVLEILRKDASELDVREILTIKSSRQAAHDPGTSRPSTEDHINNLVFEKTKKEPFPQTIVIFDDVITTGASFKAAQTILKKYYPNVPIAGIFIARSVKQI